MVKPTGKTSSEIRKLFLVELQSEKFQRKLRKYSGLSHVKERISYQDLLLKMSVDLPQASFRRNRTWWEGLRTGGYCGLDNMERLEIGLARFIMRFKAFRESTIHHELIHLAQEYAEGALTKEANRQLSRGQRWRYEYEAHLFGGPLAMIITCGPQAAFICYVICYFAISTFAS